jgi:pimeloyl-ACP methyl ester carboxylesterase
VCVFDRAGEGWSGRGPGAQDAHQVSLDLHDLLRAARVPGPYVLAGHSVGGVYALVYAAMFPGQVAGMALIDSSTPNQFDLPDYPRFYSMWRRVGALLPSVSRVGRHLFGLSSPRELSADRFEFGQLPRVFDQAKALRSLHGKPLAVVTADRDAMRGWQAAQTQFARLSSNSFQVHARGATHATLLDNQRSARIAGGAIVQVVREVRGGGA